jgi:hypothetical protein
MICQFDPFANRTIPTIYLSPAPMTNRNDRSTTAALQEFFGDKNFPMAVSLTCDNAKSHDIIKPRFSSPSMSPVSSRRSRLSIRPSSYPPKSLSKGDDLRNTSISSLALDDMMMSTYTNAQQVVHSPANTDHHPLLKPILKAGVNTTSRYRPGVKMTRSFPRLSFQLERAESSSSCSVTGGGGSLLVDDNRFAVSSTHSLMLAPPRRWNDSTNEILPATPRRRVSFDAKEFQATLEAVVQQFENGDDAE